MWVTRKDSKFPHQQTKRRIYVYNQQDEQFFLWLHFIFNTRSTCVGLYQSIFRSRLFISCMSYLVYAGTIRVAVVLLLKMDWYSPTHVERVLKIKCNHKKKLFILLVIYILQDDARYMQCQNEGCCLTMTTILLRVKWRIECCCFHKKYGDKWIPLLICKNIAYDSRNSSLLLLSHNTFNDKAKRHITCVKMLIITTEWYWQFIFPLQFWFMFFQGAKGRASSK